jgi:hypothetical protein
MFALLRAGPCFRCSIAAMRCGGVFLASTAMAVVAVVTTSCSSGSMPKPSPTPSTGTVKGALLLEAGLSIVARGVPGVISFAGPSSVTVKTDRTGRWSADIAPGTYTVTARSPKFNNGHADCAARNPVTVVRVAVTTIQVLCVGK